MRSSKLPQTLHITNLFKDSFFYSLPRVLPALSFVILTPIYTAYLSPTDYGVLALLMVLGQILTLVMWMNMNTGVLRFYHDYQGEERRRFLGTVAIGSFFFSGVICVFLLLMGNQLTQIIFKSSDIPYWPMVAAEIFTVFLGTAVIVPASILKNERKSKEWSVIQISAWLLTTALGLYFIVWLQDGAWGKIKAQLIAAIVLFVVYWIITLKHIEITFSLKIFWMNLLFGLPLLGKNLSSYIYQFSDRLIMERNVPMAHIGFFSLGDSFSKFPQMGYSSFADAWMPYFYGEAKRDPVAASVMVREISYYWAVMMAALTLFFCLFMKPMILLLACERFQNIIVIKSGQLLVVAYFVASLQIFFMYALSFAKKNNPILTTAIISAIVNFAINIMVIPHMGVLTAAWSRIFAIIINLILLYFAAQEVFYVEYRLKELLWTILIAICAFTLSIIFTPESIVVNLIKDTIIFCIFISVLFFAGFLKYSKVKKMFKDNLN